MSLTTTLMAIALSLFAIHFLLYMRHVYSLPVDDRTRYLKKGNPYRWFSLVFAGLLVLLLFTDSLFVTILLVTLLLASLVRFALKQRGHLTTLGFGAEWRQKLDEISLVAAASIVCAFVGIVIGRAI
jgi:hypothetical protein